MYLGDYYFASVAASFSEGLFGSILQCVRAVFATRVLKQIRLC